MPDTPAVTFNEDGTITLSAAFIREALEDPTTSAAVDRLIAEGHTRDEAIRRVIVTGARRLIATKTIPDGAHGTGGARRAR